MAGLGVFMAQMADRLTPASASTSSARQTALVATPAQTGLRSLSIPRDPRGHFLTEGRIDGQRLNFMVDTGATVVALNESSAERFGVRPTPGQYRANVSTANGVVKAAPIRIERIEIGELIVRDVDALVLPDEALSQNLLGMSFLSRLKRFEFADGQMVLEQ
jgi:aspartyl protease family protein